MELDLKVIFSMFKKRIWLIAMVVILFTAAVGVYFYIFAQPTYEASTKIIVNKTRTVNGETEISMGDVETNIKIMGTYKDLLKTDWIMKDVALSHPEFKLTSKDLIDKISVSESNGSQVMTFSVRDHSYSFAVEIVNAITKQFHQKIPELIEVKNITILNEADLYAVPEPIGPSPLFNVFIAFATSLLLGIGLTFLLEYLDDTLKNEHEIEQMIGLPTLAIIPKINQREYKLRKFKNKLIPKDKVGEKTYATN